MTTTIVTHPDSSPQYYGYYLIGLQRALGRLRIRFSRNDLPPLLGPRDGLPVLLEDGTRLFIAADDLTRVNNDALAWCQAYGMVNLDRHARRGPETSPKILPIGPNFGIRWTTYAGVVRYLAVARRSTPGSFASFPSRLRAALKHHHQRVTFEHYYHGRSADDYIFFLASAWSRHPETDTSRAEFIRVVKSQEGIRFEGGLVGSEDATCAAPRAYSLFEYLARTRASLLAFNTPAVHSCLGWKLGEHLAMGKAIVSLPLTREMPAPLTDRSDVHFVDGSDASIVDAIGRLATDRVYRGTLESGALRYYRAHLAPEVVINRLVDHAQALS